MNVEYPPIFGRSAFSCPACNVFAKQLFSRKIDASYIDSKPNGQDLAGRFELYGYFASKCAHCDFVSIWHNESLVYPYDSGVESPNEDLSEKVVSIYQEAADIRPLSSRGAAALLRLALQQLFIDLGESGKNLNDDIKALVIRGLPVQIQQALDVIRVNGNNAVHPGTIDFEDNDETVLRLFGLINLIAEHFISTPKRVNQLFGGLPEKDKTNINNRDS